MVGRLFGCRPASGSAVRDRSDFLLIWNIAIAMIRVALHVIGGREQWNSGIIVDESSAPSTSRIYSVLMV